MVENAPSLNGPPNHMIRPFENWTKKCLKVKCSDFGCLVLRWLHAGQIQSLYSFQDIVVLALAYAMWCNTYDNSLNLGQIIRAKYILTLESQYILVVAQWEEVFLSPRTQPNRKIKYKRFYFIWYI